MRQHLRITTALNEEGEGHELKFTVSAPVPTGSETSSDRAHPKPSPHRPHRDNPE